MKKLVSLGVACMMMLGAVQVNAMPITLDGVKKEVSSKIINDRTMIPLREFSNLMGYEIDYKGPDNIKVINPMTSSSITLAIDVSEVRDNRGNTFKAEAAPKLINGSTYVPLRVIAENLGVKVGIVNGGIVLTTEYKVDLDSALQKDGNKITAALEVDFEKNRNSVKEAQQIYSKYAKLSTSQLKGKNEEILKDLESVSILQCTHDSLAQVFVNNIVDFLSNEYSIANASISGIDISMLEVYRSTHISNISERADYVRDMK